MNVHECLTKLGLSHREPSSLFLGLSYRCDLGKKGYNSSPVIDWLKEEAKKQNLS